MVFSLGGVWYSIGTRYGFWNSSRASNGLKVLILIIGAPALTSGIYCNRWGDQVNRVRCILQNQ